MKRKTDNHATARLGKNLCYDTILCRLHAIEPGEIAGR